MLHTADLPTFLATKLNADQLQAVTTIHGTLLVIAGAGSGKTRVITTRIANLILNAQVAPQTILALTFTNKAAQEMQERVAKFLAEAPHTPTASGAPFVGTFHAYCLQLLKRHRHLLAIPDFTILDGDDQEKLVNQLLKQHQLQKTLKASAALYYISQFKNNPAKLQELQLTQREKLLRELYTYYEAAKQASRCFDFDDLLLEALKLFQRPEFKATFQQHTRHILIDEYQDTSVVQHELLRQMALTNAPALAVDSLCIVGDEDQSIYSWRGATVDNIVNVRHEFPDTQVVKIEQNYRSAAPILTVANTVIQQNKQRYPKNLWSTKQATDRVFKATCLSGQREAELITEIIAQSYQAGQTVAVLYRTHSQSRTIEEALIKQNLAYQIIGGIRFYERKEIKDLLAYLRLLVNPHDRLALERVINCPPRKLGEKFWELLSDAWQATPHHNFRELLVQLLQNGDLGATRHQAIASFLALFTALDQPDAPLTPSAALQHFIKQTAYHSYLKDSYEPREADDKSNNLKELLRAAEYYETQKANTVAGFLTEIALLQEKVAATANTAAAPMVTLMTLHAAKGLEFDTVVIAGLEEGLLPSARALNDYSAIEEERRLFYVGITRAREYLYLTHCLYRYLYGQTTEAVESRFLREIPAHLYQNYGNQSYDQQRRTPSFADPFSATEFAQILTPVSQTNHLTHAPIKPNKTSFTPAKNSTLTNTYHRASSSSAHAPKSPALTNNYQARAQLVNQRSTDPAAANSPALPYKKFTPVQHSKFGIGIVQKCEARSNDQFTVTVQFKSGAIKAIDAKFLTAI